MRDPPHKGALGERGREQLPPTSKALASVMLEAPALPVEPVFAFLTELCEEGDDWQTLALTTARSLIMIRPPVRDHALAFVLQSATSRSAPLRHRPSPSLPPSTALSLCCRLVCAHTARIPLCRLVCHWTRWQAFPELWWSPDSGSASSHVQKL